MIKVKVGQTLYDISIQLYGTADHAFALAQLNGKRLDAPLVNGEVLQTLERPANALVLRYYERNGISPASAQRAQVEVPLVKSSEAILPFKRRFNSGKVTVQVLSKQTFYDISVQYFGTSDYAFAIAQLNQKSVSASLSNGETLLLPELPKVAETLAYYQARNINPATGVYITKIAGETLYGFPDDFPYSF